MKIAKLAIIVLLLQFILSNFRPAPYFFSFEQFFFFFSTTDKDKVIFYVFLNTENYRYS